MPEEPNLTHVATTLQFCLEQLQLCEKVAKEHNCLIISDRIEDAWQSTFTALDYLRVSEGINPTPNPPASEGSPV